MKLTCGVFLFLSQLFSYYVGSTASSFSEDYANLPKIFFLNDTEECPDHYYYCKTNILLKPIDPATPPEIWKLIEKQSYYRREKIYRATCSEEKTLALNVEDELRPYNMTGEIIFSQCYQKVAPKELIKFHELLFGLLIILYGSLMAYCTIATYYSWENGSNEYVKMFSLINIWKDSQKPNRNADFNNLLCIQSLRTIGMLGVIGSHTTLCLMVITFLRNPEYFEKALNSTLFSCFVGSITLVVQIFFVISSWLLSVQLHNIVRDKGVFTLRDLVLLWINRYLRFLPAVFLSLVFIASDVVMPVLTHPHYYHLVKSQTKICRSDWWKNLLFFQNMESADEMMCHAGMWTIAADLQMFITISALFYFSRRFNISMRRLLILMAASTVSIQLFGAYGTPDYRTFPIITPRLLPLEETIKNFKKLDNYFETYGSCVTYIIGFSFGTIYFYNKQKTIFNTTMKKLLCYSFFLSIPFLCSYINTVKVNEFMETLKTISLRPLFGLAIASGILGIATNTGGIIKKILECKTLVFFGTFNYSIYMFHFAWVFGRAFFFPSYVEVSTFYYITLYIIDIIGSFSFGIFMYVVVEHPFVKLQKKLIPQIIKQKKDAERKKE